MTDVMASMFQGLSFNDDVPIGDSAENIIQSVSFKTQNSKIFNSLFLVIGRISYR